MSIVQMVKDLTTRIGKRAPAEPDAQTLVEREVSAAVAGLVRGTHDGVVSLAALAAQHRGLGRDDLLHAVERSYGRRRGKLALDTTVMNHPKPGLYQDVAYELELDDEELRCRVLG